MYDSNVMSFSITNGVQFFFLLHFQDFCVKFDGFHDFRYGTSAGTSVATMPVSASETEKFASRSPKF